MRRNEHPQGKGKTGNVSVGSLTATLYRAQKKVGEKAHQIFRLVYVEPGGRRKVRDFGSREKAREVFGEVAKTYALGPPDALSWSSKEPAEFAPAAQALEGSGVGIYGAVQQFLASQSQKRFPAKMVAEVAGYVHRGEYVLDAMTVERAGLPALQALQIEGGSHSAPIRRPSRRPVARQQRLF